MRKGLLRLRGMMISLAVLLASLAIGGNVHAESALLTAIPNKCISLRQGQICYQRVELQWQAQAQERICLWREGDEQALRCWANENSGKLRLRFSARETTAYLLVTGEQPDITKPQMILARTTVKVAWIYNSRKSKRTRWRLF